MPIGGVLATQGMIIPMRWGGWLRGDGDRPILQIFLPSKWKNHQNAYRVIPVGFKHHKKAREWDGFRECLRCRFYARRWIPPKKIGTWAQGIILQH